jgi:AP-4 complex subunit epsilon-1
MDHKFPPEYDYHKVPAPWLQIDILKILEKLGKNDQAQSKLMYDSLDKCMRRSQNICNY